MTWSFSINTEPRNIRPALNAVDVGVEAGPEQDQIDATKAAIADVVDASANKGNGLSVIAGGYKSASDTGFGKVNIEITEVELTGAPDEPAPEDIEARIEAGEEPSSGDGSPPVEDPHKRQDILNERATQV